MDKERDMENKSAAGAQNDESRETTGPSGGRMTEGGEKQGPPVDGDAGETREAPISGLKTNESTGEKDDEADDVG